MGNKAGLGIDDIVVRGLGEGRGARAPLECVDRITGWRCVEDTVGGTTIGVEAAWEIEEV
jgi:hypothetical protein